MHIIVEKFIEVEDRNFALFNYVNEQNNTIEMLMEQIQDVSCFYTVFGALYNNEILRYTLHCFSPLIIFLYIWRKYDINLNFCYLKNGFI